jgi:HEPN domain-containing protein
MREEARRWMAQGREELAMARSLLASGGYSGAAFHCHQAAEMLLKGLWIHRKRSAAPRFHDLVQLGAELEAPDEVRAALRRLNPEYVISRYPDAANGIPAENYDRLRADELVALAAGVESWVAGASG